MHSDQLDNHDSKRSVSFKIGSPKKGFSEVSLLLPTIEEGSPCNAHSRPTSPDLHSSTEHKLLIELFDLDYKKSGEGSWIESARWLKYEEDVQGQDKHWGKPHLPYLFFNDIVRLGDIMRKAIVITDLVAVSYQDMEMKIVNHLKSHNPLISDKIMELMHLRQIHVQSRKVNRSSTVMGLSRLSHSQSTVNKPNQKNKLTNAFSLPFADHMSDDEPRKKESKIGSVLNLTQDESAQVFVGESADLKEPLLIFVRLNEAVLMPEVEQNNTLLCDPPVPVRFFMFLLGPPGQPYHEIGKCLCTMMSYDEFRNNAYVTSCGRELIEQLNRFLMESLVLPPGKIDSKTLIPGEDIKRIMNEKQHIKDLSKVAPIKDGIEIPQEKKDPEKKRLFNGLRTDIETRLPHYKSDFTDAFKFQCLTSIVYIFLASIVPSITFGGLMGEYTGGKMGLIETMAAHCFCGILFSFTSAQPLLILSPTGPVLIFEASLYLICETLGLELLSVRLYCGAFVFLFCIIAVAAEASRLLKYVTAFIEEIFSCLISMIYILEALNFQYQKNTKYPIRDYEFYSHAVTVCEQQNISDFHILEYLVDCSDPPQPNSALASLIIVFLTVYISSCIGRIRKTTLFGSFPRTIISNFSVAITLVLISIGTLVFCKDFYLQKLEMPTELGFTNITARGHGLIIIPSADNVGLSLIVACVAGMLVFILIFAETEITESLLQRKERKTVKGSGMSWDMFLVGFIFFLSSIFGLPWMCSAAVQSVAHCESLTIKKKKAPGERDEAIGVIEQRVTNLVISVLIGIFMLLGKFITMIPYACLFGVFLYLGIVNLTGIEMCKRLLLIVTPLKYYPNREYCKVVSRHKIHLFTLIKVCLVFVVLLVKSNKVLAVTFPFFLMLFILFRFTLMKYMFTKQELRALDGEEESDHEPVESTGMYAGRLPMPV